MAKRPVDLSRTHSPRFAEIWTVSLAPIVLVGYQFASRRTIVSQVLGTPAVPSPWFARGRSFPPPEDWPLLSGSIGDGAGSDIRGKLSNPKRAKSWKRSTPPTIWSREVGAVEKRDVWSSLKRGFRCHCPRCGKGKLFRAFLKVDNRCSACGLDFTPHRADDLPAYLVIAIVGHLVVPAALLIETDYAPPVALQLAIYLPLTLLMSLALLQPVKGASSGCNGRCACTASTIIAYFIPPA